MPQAKIDTRGFEILELKKAAGRAAQIAALKDYYQVYFSIFTHKVHIVRRKETPDPDWILCEDWTPFPMGQQAIADAISDKLEKLQNSYANTSGLQKLIDET